MLYSLRRVHLLCGKQERGRIPQVLRPDYERLWEIKQTSNPNSVFHLVTGHITPTMS